jgi:hypothetical protein
VSSQRVGPAGLAPAIPGGILRAAWCEEGGLGVKVLRSGSEGLLARVFRSDSEGALPGMLLGGDSLSGGGVDMVRVRSGGE